MSLAAWKLLAKRHRAERIPSKYTSLMHLLFLPQRLQRYQLGAYPLNTILFARNVEINVETNTTFAGGRPCRPWLPIAAVLQ